jgi:hypothetical protein
MGISPKQSKSGRWKSYGADATKRQRRFHKILYRNRALIALLAGFAIFALAFAGIASAQEEIPQITVGERRPTKKKETGPRAIAVLRLADNGKTSLVPIAILIDGKFWDASAYKADPVPMALEAGTVYEAERAGNSLGLFTVATALHSNSPTSMTPWLGTGSWDPGGANSAKAAMKAENVPVGIDTSDQPPRLTKNPDAAKQSGANPSGTNQSGSGSNAPETNPPSSTSPSSAPQSAPQSSDPDAPPVLRRPASSEPPSAPTSTPTSSSPSSSGSTNPKPADTKSDNKPTEASNTPQTPASDSGADESGRPRLRRGKAVAEPADEDIPGYSKPGEKPSTANAATASAAKVAAAADQGAVQSIPAISDATVAQPRSYTFEWLKDEEGEKREQMIALAKDQLRAYLDARAKAQIGSTPTPKPASQTSRHTTSKKTQGPDPILENVQMIAYDLWNSNQPIIVFSAEAHLPPPPARTAHSESDSELRYSIRLVTYPDIYNNLHKLYVGVTDKYHLDLTPRLDLIDAVDADGDGRGELLFKETSDTGSGWIIYRATGDKLWKMFDSLNPE